MVTRLRNRAGRARNNRTPDKLLVTVDVEAVKGYWNGLALDEKLRKLSFDDPTLAKRVQSVTQDLRASDLQCYMLGIRGQDITRESVGMDQFAVECDARTLKPVAFFAKEEFVERQDLFQHMAHHLGGSFLNVPQGLQRKEWCEVVEPPASSWQNFMIQIFTLVEYAIFQAYQDAISNQCDEAKEDSTTGHAETLAASAVSKTSKRRARKKNNRMAAVGENESEHFQNAQENIDAETVAVCPPGEDIDLNNDPADALDSTDLQVIRKKKDRLVAAEQHDLECVVNVSEDVDIDTISICPSTVCPSTEDMSLNNDPLFARYSTDLQVVEESCLNFDWCAEGPPIDDKMEPAVELQVDWSDDGPNPTETWSAWLPNGLDGRCAEWHWVHGSHQRAFLKNTFVETMDWFPEDSRSRTRSCPARPRPADL
jgi:hypothetical protein